jgi:hypothetical protein
MKITDTVRAHANRSLARLEAPAPEPGRPVTHNFPALGIRVEGSTIRATTLAGLRAGAVLGGLAGAEAVVTGNSGLRLGRAGLAMLNPVVGLAGLLAGSRQAYAITGLADGTAHERKLEGKAMIAQAGREAARFNILAAGVARPYHVM